MDAGGPADIILSGARERVNPMVCFMFVTRYLWLNGFHPPWPSVKDGFVLF